MRRAFLQLLGMGSLMRGYVSQRPDQGSDPPPSLVPPSQAAGTLRARTVIIFGTGPNVGLFVYNGTPGKGNLVAQIVAPGVTSDPFGNSVGAVANFGHWNPAGSLLQHFGVDASGNLFLADTTGVTRIFADPSLAFIGIYDTSGASAGHLIASIASVAGTDPFGNSFLAGFSSYSSGVAANLTGVQLEFFSVSGGPANAPHVTSNTALATGTTLDVSSGSGTLAANQLAASLYDSLQSSFGVAQAVIASRAGSVGTSPPPATNALVEIQGSQALKGIATPSSPAAGNTLLFSDTNGFERMLAGLAGDTNAYQIGEVIKTSGGFTINSILQQTILSCPVGIGTYVVEVWFVVANSVAADAAGWAFSGPSAGVQLVDFESKTTGTATVGYGASATYTTQFTNQGVGGNQGILMRALIAFSAAGTLAITGVELVSPNTITVFGGWMRVRHVS